MNAAAPAPAPTAPRPPAPAWAAASGVDEGFTNGARWADFTVTGAQGDAVQRLRWIAPGTFTMGSPAQEEGRYDVETQHRVTITAGFWIGDTPVTQAFWRAVVGFTESRFNGEHLPIEGVNIADAADFCARLDGKVAPLRARLPTEAEWEYACRGGDAGPYAGCATIDEAGWCADHLMATQLELCLANGDWKAYLRFLNDHRHNARFQTQAVKGKAANPWGLYDCLGNVWEWCQDAWDEGDYPLGDVTDPLPRDGQCRVARGGSWADRPRRCRAANRGRYAPEIHADNVGMRLVIS
jgi:formylglycine-generating enzyme required for sulfatase activity